MTPISWRGRAAAPNGVDTILDLVGGTDLQTTPVLLEDRSKLVSTVDPVTAATLGAPRSTGS